MAYKSELQTLSLLSQNFDEFKDYVAEIEDLYDSDLFIDKLYGYGHPKLEAFQKTSYLQI